MSPRRLTSSARDEDGIALISVIAIMLVVSIVTAIGAITVVRGFNETNRARTSTTAFAAADSAIDIITWRMNKQLVASEIHNLTSLVGGVLQLLGCTQVDALGLKLDLTVANCDQEIPVGGGTTAHCSNDLAVEVLPGADLDLSELPVLGNNNRLLARNVVCSATVRDVTRRIFARVDLDIELGEGLVGSPTSLWRQTKWVECLPDPAAPCPPA